MPATSKSQRTAAAIAEHHPEELHARNKGLLDMSKEQLSHFASTPEKGLPAKKGKKGGGVPGNEHFETKLLSESECSIRPRI